MANQRGTFSKRNREMKLKDRAKEKAERRQNRPAGTSDTKGPQIAWDQPGGVEGASSEDAAVASTESGTNTDNDIKDGPTTPSTAKPPASGTPAAAKPPASGTPSTAKPQTSGAPSTAKPQTPPTTPSPTTPKPTAQKPPTSAKPQR